MRRLADPVATPFQGERRRAIRQKLHTPVYASFNGSQTNLVVDLSELLDLHEDGFAVQTSERLEVDRALTVCLDLPETKSFIHGRGRVVWSDDSGRGGIQLSGLPQSARRILQEWLFANLLIACANHGARTEQLARRDQEKPRELSPTVVPVFDDREMLSAVEAVRIEIREIGGNLDAVFQLLTERALRLTRASGAALAFLTNGSMIWRAQVGEPAPPIGASVDVKQGLSAECVRSGLLVSTEDMENDPRVDPELGRALGIGSLLAAPIVSGFQVVGLLEVFAPEPRHFTKAHETVMRLLADMIPKVQPHRKIPALIEPENTRPLPPLASPALSSVSQAPALKLGPTEFGLSDSRASDSDSIEVLSINVTGEALWEHELEASAGEIARPDSPSELVAEQLPDEIDETAPKPSAGLPLGLLGMAILVVTIALGYLIGPIIEKHWAPSPQASQRPSTGDPTLGQGAVDPSSNQSSTIQTSAVPRSSDQRQPLRSLTELQALADRGDADAQWQMGVRYHNGDGVPQNDRLAMLWFQLAAEQGHVPAQSALGSYYWAGRGVTEDLSKAYMWSAIALAGGDEISKSRLEGLSSRMTRAEIAAARQQADAWIHAHTQRTKSETR